MSTFNDPKVPPPDPRAEIPAEESLHSPIKPLLWMALVLVALIAFGVMTK
jgi:hypothetical protein